MTIDLTKLPLEAWAIELGFDALGITHRQLADDEAHLQQWLADGMHGEMQWMASHGTKRSRPEELVPGTVTVLSVRMNYLTPGEDPETVLNDSSLGYISRYALGRDYHKVMRPRLQKLADKITEEVGDFGYRAFVDSAPVLEKALARNAGLGWIGKNTNLINKDQGSFFFLGELLTDLPLPVKLPDATPTSCGSCTDCIPACPTGAIIAPFKVDARRCISYLTIELRGSIPLEMRPLIGNRIYGCDDCQLACPWNKFAQLSDDGDYRVRHALDAQPLSELFEWDEQTFLDNTAGMAIRRIGYECWLRNIAVALGNAEQTPAIISALKEREHHESALVREHVSWALEQQNENSPTTARS